MIGEKFKCSKCGLTTVNESANGILCKDCWRRDRAEKRKVRQAEALEQCFSYGKAKKFTEKEAKILNEVMVELERKQ